MASYTPLQPGQAPALGTSGQAVADLQTQLNTQNAGKAGWTPLAVDAKYGPLTQVGVGFKPTNQLIVTGSKPAKEFAQNTQDITQMIEHRVGSAVNTPAGAPNPNDPNQEMGALLTNYSDPYTQMLDKIGATSDKATQNLIATIKAKKANRESTVNTEYDRLKSGLFALAIDTDQLQFTPDLVYGKQMQAENQRITKLQELDQDEATALLEAQQASENKDFELLREKKAYLKEIKKTKLDLLKEKYDTLSYENKIGEEQATQIYDELQKMPADKKIPFLQTLADKLDIPLTALTSQVAEITRGRAKKSSSSSSITKNKTSAIANINSILNDRTKDESGYSVRGEDNYVDPSVYLDAFHQWQQADFGDEEFFNKFDPKIYINPTSYSQLPAAFRPKKTGRSS